MDIRKESLLRVVIAIIATMSACVTLMIASACIPRSLLLDNARQSADYFSGHDPFFVRYSDYVNSIQDNYADTYILAVAYGIDEKHPFSSAIRAMYTQGKYEAIADGFKAQVYDERTLDKEYGRYWHGMAMIVRLMLLFTDVYYMRLIAGMLTIMLFILDIILLFQRGEKAVAVCMGLSLIGIHSWMLFYSLEYVSTFFVAALAVLFILLKKKAFRDLDAMMFFAAVGVVTCFFDFLSTETITFTLPMIVFIVLWDKAEMYMTMKERIRLIFANGISWIVGYASMQAVKFALLFAVCGKDAFDGAIKEAVFRMGGEVYLGNSNLEPVATLWQKYKGAIWHNLAALLPTRTAAMTEYRVLFPVILILLVCFSLIYLFHGKIHKERMVSMMIIAFIPYARYLLLSSHSYEHFFFTYRAQMVTLLAIMIITWENAFRPLFLRIKGVGFVN